MLISRPSLLPVPGDSWISDGIARRIEQVSENVLQLNEGTVYTSLLRLQQLRWGLWEELVSDHGGQFISHDFARVNKRLGIRHDMYEKGHPWQNLIESQFGIQARLGECTEQIKS